MILSHVYQFWVVQPGQELLSGINTHQHHNHRSTIQHAVAEVISPGQELLRRLLRLHEWDSALTLSH
jgi:hypothetical protein